MATAYVALDTNVLVHSLSLVKALHAKLLPTHGALLVPLQVVHGGYYRKH